VVELYLHSLLQLHRVVRRLTRNTIKCIIVLVTAAVVGSCEYRDRQEFIDNGRFLNL